MVYPDSLRLLWQNDLITGGSNKDMQISSDIKSVVCELRDGNIIEKSLGFVELFRSYNGSFDGMMVYMVDRNVVSFVEYQLMIPTYPEAAALPTWNTCSGFIKGSGSGTRAPTIYRIYAGKRVADDSSALDSA